MAFSGTTAQAQAPQSTHDRSIGIWLLVCCGMIFAMAVIGAITRLTESGLSIMEWAPISGALPPLSEAEWQRVFALYQQIPEYQEQNAGMSLAEFKTIFWWEYIHRLWGRLIGVVFALPFLWFLLRGKLRRGLAPHLAVMFVLGGLQGLLGWYMVASGFAERVDVSQYRLAAHLSLALLIYGYVFWVALSLLLPNPVPNADRHAGQLTGGFFLLLALVALTILTGAFVAGLNAGLTYNTFPLMDGDLIPAGYGMMSPWIVNIFENIAAVQFNHRLLAVSTVGFAIAIWLWSTHLDISRHTRLACSTLAILAVAQLGLGIATLLLVVPVWLGALHQAGAILVLTAALAALYLLRARSQSLV